MKVVLFCGGFGMRLREYSESIPKPMVKIGYRPILWHIMKYYAHFGHKDFILCLGWKADVIKEYFLNFYAFNNNISIDLETGNTIVHNGKQPNWTIHLVDTGLHTQTGGRLKRLQKWLSEDETFLFTYGDGVADLDIEAVIKFHHAHGKLATVTTVRTPARFGRIAYDGDRICHFNEKPQSGEGWINGGFFVLNRKAIDYIEGDETPWENAPLEGLARDGQMIGYRHNGFWSCMDTLREKNYLEELWASQKAPWKIWD